MMRSLAILTLAAVQASLAQDLPRLRLPRTGGAESERVAAVVKDPVSAYASRREAALAAQQAGYKAATVERHRARAMQFMLVSLRRDPFIAKSLYNMGLLCAEEERWHDALEFYRAAQKAEPESEAAKLAAPEIERVQLLMDKMSTPEGRRQREVDAVLLKANKRAADPIGALSDLRPVMAEKSRWEVAAFAGVMRAKAGAFGESVKDLEEAAARLAPGARRTRLQSAAEVARREANFTDRKNSGDELSAKQQWDAAGNGYAKAWEESPSHVDIGMEAAKCFLMADQVPRAVVVLTSLRDSRSDEYSKKAVAMLKELGAVSEDARREAGRERGPAAGDPPVDPATHIASLVGTVVTRQMELASQATPLLLEDKTRIIGVPDEELAAAQNTAGILSTQSVFAIYLRDLEKSGLAPPQQQAPPQQAPPPVQIQEPPALARVASPPPASSGDARQQAVSSEPPGATVVFDNDPQSVCVTPCQISLPQGRHTLVATIAKYRDEARIITVQRTNTPIEIAMTPKKGSLAVVSQIPGAFVFLNGKKTESRTPAQFSLVEGEYEVGIEVGGEMATKKTAIQDGSIIRLIF